MTDKSGQTSLTHACLKDDCLCNTAGLFGFSTDLKLFVHDNGWSMLHTAALYLNPASIQILLSLGMTVNMATKIGETPLMCACMNGGHLDNIKTLFEHGADIKQLTVNNGWSALHFAARDSSPEIIEYLLSLEMAVNMTTTNGLTPLMCACLNGGRLDNIKTFFKNGADIKQQTVNNGWSALHFAARDSSPEIIEYLLSLGMTVNMTTTDSSTPLMCACLNGGRLANIKTLFEHGADIKQLTVNDGWSALHFAARDSSPEIIEYLLSLGMTVNMTTTDSSTPLMCACLNGGRLANIKTLFKHGANIKQLTGNDGWSALHYAASYSSPEIIEYLLSLEMTVNMTTTNGLTPLMCACYRDGHLDNIKMLLKNGADIKQLEFIDGFSVLHFAATLSNPDIVAYLISQGMTVNMTTKTGKTPLICACLNGGRLDNIKTLFEHGADIKQITVNDGWSALHFAARDSSPEIIEYLLSLEMTVNMTTKTGKTPLMCACLNGGRLDNIKTLFKHGADIKQLEFSDEWSSLHFAAMDSSPKIIEYLLSLGMTVNMTTKAGGTPLMCACLNGGRLDNIEILFKHGVDIKQLTVNDGWSALHFAARDSSPEIIEYLLSQGMTVNMTDKSGLTPLMCACFKSDGLNNNRMLFEHGTDIKQLEFKRGESMFRVAARDSSPKVIENSFSLGMTVNMTNKSGQTPTMCICLNGGRLDNIKTLFEHGADIKQLAVNDGWSALHFAAMDSSQEIIEYLLSLGMKVNMTTTNGLTPLMCACFEGGRLDNIKTLFKHGADIKQLEFDNGWSALHFAARDSSPEIIEYFLSLEMTVNMTTKTGKTPLMCACLNGGRLDNIKTLFEHGADIRQLEFEAGWSALHFAARDSSPDSVDYLLSLGMTVNMKDKNGWTPLLVACNLTESVGNIIVLLKRGANFFAKDDLLRNAFHLATLNSHSAPLTFLLNYFCRLATYLSQFCCDTNCCEAISIDSIALYDIAMAQAINSSCSNVSIKGSMWSKIKSDKLNLNSLDKFGMSPLMLACERNEFSNAKLLIEFGANVNMKGSHDFTALHFAAKYGNLQLLELFLSSGDWQRVDAFNCNLLYWACEGNKLDTVKFLVANGVRLDIISTEGWNLLHIAAVCAGREICEYLLDNNVSLEHLDKAGRNPLSLALVINRKDIIKFLLQRQNSLTSCNVSLIGNYLRNMASEGKEDNRFAIPEEKSTKIDGEDEQYLKSISTLEK